MQILAEVLADFDFPTVMILPQKEVADPQGIAAVFVALSTRMASQLCCTSSTIVGCRRNWSAKMYESGLLSWIKYAVVRAITQRRMITYAKCWRWSPAKSSSVVLASNRPSSTCATLKSAASPAVVCASVLTARSRCSLRFRQPTSSWRRRFAVSFADWKICATGSIQFGFCIALLNWRGLPTLARCCRCWESCHLIKQPAWQLPSRP